MADSSEKAIKRHPNNYWTRDEVVLGTFLKSRDVTARKIAAILNGRYAHKVRQASALLNKLLAVRRSEREAGRIDLTHDKHFTNTRNVDRWIMGIIGDANARSALLTFTDQELEVLHMNRSQVRFSTVEEMLAPFPGQMPAVGPSQIPAQPATFRRILPAVASRQLPTIQETSRMKKSVPAVDPSQVPDQVPGQINTGQRQMFDFPTTNERPVESAWPIWDATLEALFPGLGPPVPGWEPPAAPGESPFTMQSGTGEERAHDPYHESQDFEEWYDQEEEEGEDAMEDDEVGEDEDDYDSVNRLQRDENDNYWWDDAQEEEDG